MQKSRSVLKIFIFFILNHSVKFESCDLMIYINTQGGVYF